MDSKTILKEIKSILEADATLKTYIKQIFIGDRQRIYGDSYPVIVIDTPYDVKKQVLEGNVQENSLTVQIIPAILIQDREEALISDTGKGILDIVSDIKASLNGKYPSLNKTCLYFDLSVPAISDFPDMKGKFATIDMTVIYRETI